MHPLLERILDMLRGGVDWDDPNVDSSDFRPTSEDFDGYRDDQSGEKDNCLPTEVSAPPDARAIEVQVYSSGNEPVPRIVRDYCEGALVWSFGDTYAVDVTISDLAVPEGVRDIESFVDFVENSDHDPAKDANVLATGTGSAMGGGAYCIAPDHNIADLSSEACAKRSGGSKAHGSIQSVLHEMGHCLGLRHSQDTDYPPRWDGKTTPMGTYEDGPPYVHRYHPQIPASSIDVK